MAFGKRTGLYESAKITYISIKDIIPNPMQPRTVFDMQALDELTGSILQFGVLQPLSVRRRGRKFELVAGHRRLIAATQAGLREVPCIILDIDSGQSSLLALIENLQRKNLDFIEEAQGIQNLISTYELSQEEVARKIGRSQSAIANKLRLLRLPQDALCVIRNTGLSERHARALLRLENEADMAAVLDTIVKKNLNVAKTEAYIDYFLAAKKSPPEPRVKATYILKDVRLFLNTVSKGVNMMKQSGLDAKYGKDETESDIVVTIRIPKKG